MIVYNANSSRSCDGDDKDDLKSINSADHVAGIDIDAGTQVHIDRSPRFNPKILI